MSNAARKARKRAGIPFEKPAKRGTRIVDRIIPLVQKKGPKGPYVEQSHRAAKRNWLHYQASQGLGYVRYDPVAKTVKPGQHLPHV